MIGVSADDITGANDIGIMFAKFGLSAHVFSDSPGQPWTEQAVPADMVIVDTDSRFDAPEVAYQKVFRVTKGLQEMGCRRFIKKTCSVFRGNIGVEFDAMLDALHQSFAVVVLGFPKNGRTTVNGEHYVRGVKLEASEFRTDPMHPMTQSNLVDILQAQTRRKVGLVTHDVVERGPEALCSALRQMALSFNYVIVDVTDQAALATIAKATAWVQVFCGSSALAEELARLSPASEFSDEDIEPPAADSLGVLCAAGSLTPQTKAQVAHLRANGVFSLELDSSQLFDEASRRRYLSDVSRTLAERLKRGEHVLVHSEEEPEQVARTMALGEQLGLTHAECLRTISSALADAVHGTMSESGIKRLVTAGGDTSATICRRLGIRGMRVWREIEPGLPSGITFTDPPLWVVLKSGSFGPPDFLNRAMRHLKEGCMS